MDVPLLDVLGGDVSSTRPCHARHKTRQSWLAPAHCAISIIPDRRLRVRLVVLLLDPSLCSDCSTECPHADLCLQVCLDLQQLSRIGHFDGHDRIEFATFDETGDEGVTIQLVEVTLVCDLDWVELRDIVCLELLVDDLDLDEVVEIALLEFGGVDEASGCLSFDGPNLDSKRA